MRGVAALVVALALGLAACGAPTKHEILSKVEQVKTRAELERALGAPSDRNKLGPLETWTYEASDGSVTFLITGDEVALQASGD